MHKLRVSKLGPYWAVNTTPTRYYLTWADAVASAPILQRHRNEGRRETVIVAPLGSVVHRIALARSILNHREPTLDTLTAALDALRGVPINELINPTEEAA